MVCVGFRSTIPLCSLVQSLDFLLCHQRVWVKVLLNFRSTCSEILSLPIQVIVENKAAESLMLFQLTVSESWNHNAMDVERDVCAAPLIRVDIHVLHENPCQ